MTLRTPLCDLLGIEHPIIQAPMASASTIELVAAVCEAAELVRTLVQEACDTMERLRHCVTSS